MESLHGRVTLHRVLPPDYDEFVHRLGELMGSKDPRRFPGPNPCSLERADFRKLTSQPYWVCEKTDGIRLMCMCFTTRDNKQVCCVVDRSMAFYLLPLRNLPTATFQGTVMDGELAFNKCEGVWQLLCFDAYVLCGSPIGSRPFSRRLECMRRTMTPYSPDASDAVLLRMKDFVSLTRFDTYMDLETVKRNCYDIDGLILTPEHTPPCAGRCPDLLKLKTHHTVDFLILPDGMSLAVYDTSRHEHVPVARLGLPGPSPRPPPGCIVECSKGSKGTWDVVDVRRDKTTANDMLTYTKTQVNMKEAITYDDLMRVMRIGV